MSGNVYAAIDLKSFYASVECVARGLDPLTTNLVVADERRTEKTICLAVTPTLKAYGLSGRSRLFEVVEKAKEVLASTGKPLEYIVAPPRMKLYMETSAKIYEEVYLHYASAEDIHVYSIDEVFIDLTRYLAFYGITPHELVRRIIADILKLTGITATAGIGTNLFLAKVAMDIVAKHVPADQDGVRIAELNEQTYREKLWSHQPLTSFWRVGRGIAARLRKYGCFTMGDVARFSLRNEDALFREFGVDAELLIDHAWGQENCTMADIKCYRPESASLSQGQVLSRPYCFEEGRIIVREMAEQMALELVAKHLVASGVSLAVVYDREALQTGQWHGETETDWYGRIAPKTAHGGRTLLDAGGYPLPTSSSQKIIDAAVSIYEEVTDRSLPVRRFYIDVADLHPADEIRQAPRQLDLFSDPEILQRESETDRKEARIQQAMLQIKKRYGKNAILRGTSYQESSTARERNAQIGGHAAEANEP
ncbi:MAG: DNA methylase [Clostridiales bacterium]|nr:DNA methylase [Clostridiales bacterium]